VRLEVLESQLLEAPHGFPTRAGGASLGAFASLNASLVVGDAPELVEVNLERLARHAGGHIATVRQVHGAVVLRAPVSPEAPADGLWTSTPGGVVGVRTADCVPILIEDRASGRVAAVHAGWRGVEARIVEVAVQALVADGARVADLRVATGPCIQRCCYEVDGDLPGRFSAAFGPAVVVAQPGAARLHLDLPLALERSLAAIGLLADQLDRLGECTCCDQRFFSHRRDRGLTGRHLNFIRSPA
jgi:YfiH family protein